MLKDISGIQLLGANFESTSNLMLLKPLDKNSETKSVIGTLLYGRNGAGKSTIAKAFKKIKGEEQETILQAFLLDKDGNQFEISDEEKNHIFVFDEDYVDANIKFHESGLNTIVMMGQQVQIEEQLQEAQKLLSDLKTELSNQEKVVFEYSDYNNLKSPSYFLSKIRASLQGDDCWAGRDRKIKGTRQKTGVRDDTYKQFISINTLKTRDQLLIDFNEKLKELRVAQQGDAAISTEVPTLFFNYNENNIASLLKLKIEKPVLSEREVYLLNLVQTGKSNKLGEMVSTFSDDSISICPTCLQPVTKEYKEDLVESVQKVLSKTVEEHQESLISSIAQEIVIDLSPFSKLESNYETCLHTINQINEEIRINNSIIQTKIDDPYTPCNQTLCNISNLVSKLKTELINLESARVEFNKKITATDPIKDELVEINSEIAHLDIKENYLYYLAAEEQQKIEKQKLAEINEKCNIQINVVDELDAKLKNVKVAVDIINENLRYIYFSNDRFAINYQNDCYELLSNGKSVKPSQISQGERNIIGLCYYFASILQNQDKTKAYSNEYLLVIDDPVSSFDIENRTGIMSFLRYQLGKFLLGNKNSRVVVMTHDLLTYYNSEKIFEELLNASKVIFNGEKRIYNIFELKQKMLDRFCYKKRQEYTELMIIVYNYALGNADDYEIVIGNIMRQMLEAFSTFTYKKGIEDISTDKNVLSCIDEIEYREYFENLMYRLILNNGSHREKQVEAMTDLNYFTVISKEEKQRTAKEILCFIYLLNEQHLLSHLKDCSDVKANIENWCKEIKEHAFDIK